MTINDWQELGIVCGALLALGTLIGLTYRAVIRPVWRTIKRLNQVADILLGDRARAIPSLPERLDHIVSKAAALDQQMQAHLEWHATRARARPRPADPVPP